MDLRAKIDAWMAEHREEMIADIGRLVSIPSVSANTKGGHVYGEGCAHALDTFLGIGKSYGFETENFEYYGGRIVLPGDGKNKTIGMWSHLDIVPEGERWIYPPYECTRAGDYIIGRGVQDNKGPAILDLYVLRCLRDLNVPLKSSVAVYGGCAEEAGMDDIAAILERTPAPDFSFVTDCGFPLSYGEKGIWRGELRSGEVLNRVLELTGGTVVNVVPDSARMALKATMEAAAAIKRLPNQIMVRETEQGYELSARGISRHAACPEGGINAIAVLLEAVLDAGLVEGTEKDALAFAFEIARMTDGSALDIACADEPSGSLTCNGGLIRTERRSLVLTVDIRYPSTAQADSFTAKIYEACRRHGYAVGDIENNLPYLFDRDSPWLACLMDAYREVTGSQEQPYVMGGGTYARKLPNAVAFGPALERDYSVIGLPDGHGDCHTPDEAECISNMLKAMKIYILAILALDKQL